MAHKHYHYSILFEWKTDEEKKVVFSLQSTFPVSKPNQTILVYNDYGGRGPAWIYALGRWYDYEFGREHGGAGVYCACGPLHLFPLPFRFTTPGLNILDFNAPTWWSDEFDYRDCENQNITQPRLLPDSVTLDSTSSSSSTP